MSFYKEGKKVIIGGKDYRVVKVDVTTMGHIQYMLESEECPPTIVHKYESELNDLLAVEEMERTKKEVEDIYLRHQEKVMEAVRPSLKDNALRYNSGKPPLSMIDPTILELTAQVLDFGASKYARNNWKKGFEVSSVMDSLLRHAFAFASGEDKDPESGISHLGHIVCNAMFIAYYMKQEDYEDER